MDLQRFVFLERIEKGKIHFLFLNCGDGKGEECKVNSKHLIFCNVSI